MKLLHSGHDKHMCKLWADTYDPDEVKDIVKNPNFICKVCGRVAAKEENLCDPTTI